MALTRKGSKGGSGTGGSTYTKPKGKGKAPLSKSSESDEESSSGDEEPAATDDVEGSVASEHSDADDDEQEAAAQAKKSKSAGGSSSGKKISNRQLVSQPASADAPSAKRQRLTAEEGIERSAQDLLRRFGRLTPAAKNRALLLCMADQDIEVRAADACSRCSARCSLSCTLHHCCFLVKPQH